MATSSWWMSTPRYFGVPSLPSSAGSPMGLSSNDSKEPLFPFRFVGKKDKFIYKAAEEARGREGAGGADGKEPGHTANFGAAVIDEVWDVTNLSTELASMIERFDMRSTDDDGADAPVDVHSCVESASSADKSSYSGSTAEKDAKGERKFGLPSSAYLELLRSAEGARHLVTVCNILAQDYICFGYEPPPECEQLTAIMRTHRLLGQNPGR